MGILSQHLIKEFKPVDCGNEVSLLHSMPIITCSGKRQGKVAEQITSKGYCLTKGMYYYGVELHALGFYRAGKLPHPEQIIITNASENDLIVFKDNWAQLRNRTFFGDKIYQNKAFFETVYREFNSKRLTPVKYPKDMPENIKKFNKAADDLFSREISRIRQPIEAWFNWLIQKSDIQNASKERSIKGLTFHLSARIAAAFIGFIF